MPTLQEQVTKAENALQSGAIQQAVELCSIGLRHFPKHITFHYLLGEAQRARNQIDDAELNFRRVLSADPEYTPARRSVAMINEARRDLLGAFRQIEHAFELNPGDQDLRADLLRVSNALSMSGLATGQQNGAKGRLKLTRGALARVYARSGLYDQAVAEFNAAIARNPRRLDLLVGLAVTLWHADRHEEAVDVSRRILADSPDCLQALLIYYFAAKEGIALPPVDELHLESPTEAQLLRHIRDLDPDDHVARTIFPNNPLPEREPAQIADHYEPQAARAATGPLTSTQPAGTYTDWFTPDMAAETTASMPPSTAPIGEPPVGAGTSRMPVEAGPEAFSFLDDDLAVEGAVSNQIASPEELAAFEAELAAMEAEPVIESPAGTQPMAASPSTNLPPFLFEESLTQAMPQAPAANLPPFLQEAPQQADLPPFLMEAETAAPAAASLPPFLIELEPPAQRPPSGPLELPPFLIGQPAAAESALPSFPPSAPVELPPFLAEPEQQAPIAPAAELPPFLAEPAAAQLPAAPAHPETPVPSAAELPPFLAEPALPQQQAPAVEPGTRATDLTPFPAQPAPAEVSPFEAHPFVAEPVPPAAELPPFLAQPTAPAQAEPALPPFLAPQAATPAPEAAQPPAAELPPFLAGPAPQPIEEVPPFLAQPPVQQPQPAPQEAPAASLPPFLRPQQPTAPAENIPPFLRQAAPPAQPQQPAPAADLPPFLAQPAAPAANPLPPFVETPPAQPAPTTPPAEPVSAAAPSVAPLQEAKPDDDEWADLLSEDFGAEIDPDTAARLEALLNDPNVMTNAPDVPAMPGVDFSNQGAQTIADAMRAFEQQANQPASTPAPVPHPAQPAGIQPPQPASGSSSHTELAHRYSASGQFDMAAEEYNNALRDEPQQVQAIIEGLQQIIALRPDHLAAHKVLGDAYMRAGQFQEALQEFDWLSKNQQ